MTNEEILNQQNWPKAWSLPTLYEIMDEARKDERYQIFSTSFPPMEVMKRLIEATDILLHERNYDRQGWEGIEYAWRSANDFMKQFKITTPNPTISK